MAFERKTYVTSVGYMEVGEIVDADMADNEEEFRTKYPSMMIVKDKELKDEWIYKEIPVRV